MIHDKWVVDLTFLVITVSLCLQLVAAWIAVSLIRMTRHRAWFFLSLAILLMATRRAFSLYKSVAMGIELDSGAESIALLISLLMFFGLLGLRRWLAPAVTALSESEERYRIIAETAQDVILSIDENSTIIYAAPSIELVFGYKPEEIYGEKLTILMPEYLRQSHLASLRRYLETGKKHIAWQGVQLLGLHKSGKEIPLEVSFGEFVQGRRHIFTGIIRDISTRKQAEATLRESEERYRELFESNPHPMWIYDVESFEFLTVNDAATEHYGYSREEFLNMTIKDIRPIEDVPTLLKVAAEGSSLIRKAGIWRHRKKDGTIIRVEITAHDLQFDGRPARLVLSNDVTERLKAEEEIRNLNAQLENRVKERTAQLEEANKELEAFSYSVSHDLRAPLRAIDGFSKVLMQEHLDKLDAEGIRVLKIIRNSTQQMGELIDDLLAFSRLSRQSIQFSDIDMTELVRTVYKEMDTAGRKMEFLFDELPSAYGDRSMIRQVVANLLSNAIKFTRHKENAKICIGGNSAEKNEYHVKDNGSGFDMKYAHKLFGVFQRLHTADEFEGTGVGLAIVQRIIHRHGGKVWAEAKPNEGATFYFSLPRKEANHDSI